MCFAGDASRKEDELVEEAGCGGVLAREPKLVPTTTTPVCESTFRITIRPEVLSNINALNSIVETICSFAH